MNGSEALQSTYSNFVFIMRKRAEMIVSRECISNHPALFHTSDTIPTYDQVQTGLELGIKKGGRVI